MLTYIDCWRKFYFSGQDENRWFFTECLLIKHEQIWSSMLTRQYFRFFIWVSFKNINKSLFHFFKHSLFSRKKYDVLTIKIRNWFAFFCFKHPLFSREKYVVLTIEIDLTHGPLFQTKYMDESFISNFEFNFILFLCSFFSFLALFTF